MLQTPFTVCVFALRAASGCSKRLTSLVRCPWRAGTTKSAPKCSSKYWVRLWIRVTALISLLTLSVTLPAVVVLVSRVLLIGHLSVSPCLTEPHHRLLRLAVLLLRVYRAYDSPAKSVERFGPPLSRLASKDLWKMVDSRVCPRSETALTGRTALSEAAPEFTVFINPRWSRLKTQLKRGHIRAVI